MPIYAYHCTSCGTDQEVLQKIQDPVLTICTQCHQPSLIKKVTAAAFQLKGTGWYVTDFKNQSPKAEKVKNNSESQTTEKSHSTAQNSQSEQNTQSDNNKADSAHSTISTKN